MIEKLINYLKNLSKNQKDTLLKLDRLNELEEENIWANVYHDSIRGKDFLNSLSLNIGRWAGNYSFFYILNRILADYKPKRIIEFGLGESSKFISTYIENELNVDKHIIIEQDEVWLNHFSKNFQLSKSSEVVICPLVKRDRFGFEVNSYDNIEDKVTTSFNLYVVDGPFGSPRYSRFDIVYFIKQLDENSDFIILFDDCNRKGEKDTLQIIIDSFKERNISVYVGFYTGSKSVALIASEKNKFFTTM